MVRGCVLVPWYPVAVIAALTNDGSHVKPLCIFPVVTSDHRSHTGCVQGDVALLASVVSALLFVNYSVRGQQRLG